MIHSSDVYSYEELGIGREDEFVIKDQCDRCRSKLNESREVEICRIILCKSCEKLRELEG